MPDFLDGEWGSIDGKTDIVMSLPGRDLNFTRDTLISLVKFYHVVECARAELQRGAATWTLVEAYHAALLGSRALSAIYGILTYSVRGRTLLVDYRPEFGSTDHRKSFKKEHREIENPIRILTPEKALLLEQRDSWALLERLCNITNNEESRKRIGGLKEICDLPLSRLRNSILYDSVFWMWRDEFALEEVDITVATSRISGDDEDVRNLADSLFSILKIATDYTKEFCEQIGFDLTLLPPIAGKGLGPSALFDWPITG
jgi:hypothetical protein